MHRIVAVNTESCHRLDGNVLSHAKQQKIRLKRQHRLNVWPPFMKKGILFEMQGCIICKVLKIFLQIFGTPISREGNHASPLQERYATPFSWFVFCLQAPLCLHAWAFAVFYFYKKFLFFEIRHAKIGRRLFFDPENGSKSHWQIEFVTLTCSNNWLFWAKTA